MKDIIEKSINLGLGIAAATKEKVESLVDEMIAKGQVEKQEKSTVVNEIFSKLEQSETEFKKKTIAVVKEAVDKLDYATKKDIKELKKTVSNLEKKINSK